jgi:hypothetical protein
VSSVGSVCDTPCLFCVDKSSWLTQACLYTIARSWTRLSTERLRPAYRVCLPPQCGRFQVQRTKARAADAGMSKIERLEERVHGRRRNLDDADDLRFGVHEDMLYARNTEPVHGAQWTGIVTRIAIQMLESGAVDAVVCVQSDEGDR